MKPKKKKAISLTHLSAGDIWSKKLRVLEQFADLCSSAFSIRQPSCSIPNWYQKMQNPGVKQSFQWIRHFLTCSGGTELPKMRSLSLICQAKAHCPLVAVNTAWIYTFNIPTGKNQVHEYLRTEWSGSHLQIGHDTHPSPRLRECHEKVGGKILRDRG